VRRWKKAKAPVNDPEKMKGWLAGRQRIPSGTLEFLNPKARAVPPPKPPLPIEPAGLPATAQVPEPIPAPAQLATVDSSAPASEARPVPANDIPDESQQGIAVALGIGRTTLNTWYKEGCPRTSAGEITDWAIAHNKRGFDSKELAAARLEVVQEQGRKLKRENDKADRLVIDFGDVDTALQKGMAMMFEAMDREFSSLPPALKGLAEPEIQARLATAVESFKAVLRAELAKVVQK
jgi:hypothetical protein